MPIIWTQNTAKEYLPTVIIISILFLFYLKSLLLFFIDITKQYLYNLFVAKNI